VALGLQVKALPNPSLRPTLYGGLRPLREQVNSNVPQRLFGHADARILTEWKELGYKDEVMEKIFHPNAERILGL
jgi:hypothetical protein